jgi:2-oxo-4-hydroxy-4-carboxy-5-ureidoimidazoline decarboxylase
MSERRISLDELNAASREVFVATLGDIFEHAPWVAEAAAASRPFATVAALHGAMMRAVETAPANRQLAFLGGHPELAGKVARAGAMTAASVDEQGSLGLDRLSEAEFQRFGTLNAAYRARYGFPFIVCVRRHTRDSILDQFARRLENAREVELKAALAEIGYITRLRLVTEVDGPGVPQTTGRLSTHVLDTVLGRPAGGVRVVLEEIGASGRGRLVDTRTNPDGRTDVPLMGGAPLRIGTYELAFHIGGYFAERRLVAAEPAFLDVVPIRFAIAEPEGHYHVPLLASPWSYTTYRGS